MNQLERRVIKLERKKQKAPDVHPIWVNIGQTEAEARRAYLLPINPGDKVYFLGWNDVHAMDTEAPQEQTA